MRVASAARAPCLLSRALVTRRLRSPKMPHAAHGRGAATPVLASSGGQEGEKDGASSLARPAVLVASGVPLLGALAFVVSAGGPSEALQSVLAVGNSPLGALYFGLGYSAAVVALLPASALTLAAGYLFGPVKGTAIVSLASTAGALAAFLLARSALRPLVSRALAGAGSRFEALDASLGADGGRLVFLIRLSPLFPYSLTNYALGLTSVRLLPYLLSSWLGALPGTFAFVYLGATADAASQGLPPSKLALYGLGALATLAVTRAVSRAANAALSGSEEQPPRREL